MNEPSRREFLAGAGAFAAVALDPKAEPWTRLATDTELPVAVVGVGRQGRSILGELTKIGGVRIAAICDENESRRRSGLRRAQGARDYADVEALLAGEPDVAAVFVATPTHRHAEVALPAIAADKHVFVESPLAASLDDARAIAKAARGSQRVVQVGFQGRSNPVYRLARSFSRAGATGDVVSLRALHHKKASWRTSSRDPATEKALNWKLDPEVSLGLPGEVGAQQFDVLHWFLGRYPIAVTGSGGVRHWRDGREVADTVHLDFEFEDGVHLTYMASSANSYEGTYELLSGSQAAIKLSWTHGWMFKEADAPTLGWEVYANRQQFHHDQGITLIADATQLAAQDKLKDGVGLPQSPLYYALADFLKSATERKEVVCSVEEGLRSTVVGILAQRAVLEGGTIAITEDDLKVS